MRIITLSVIFIFSVWRFCEGQDNATANATQTVPAGQLTTLQSAGNATDSGGAANATAAPGGENSTSPADGNGNQGNLTTIASGNTTGIDNQLTTSGNGSSGQLTTESSQALPNATGLNQLGPANEAVENATASMNVTAFDKPDRSGFCPAVQPNQKGPCMTRCMSDADCPVATFKCCSNGCGRECKPAVQNNETTGGTGGPGGAGNETKPGQCPSVSKVRRQAADTSPTRMKCNSSDSECPGEQKCCFANDAVGFACTAASGGNQTESAAVSNENGTSPQQRCQDPNAAWSNCGSSCGEETCQQPAYPTCASTQCVAGCFCVYGYVKQSSAQEAVCVQRSQCGQGVVQPQPSVQPYPQQPAPSCPDMNAFWSECGPPCQETCQQLASPSNAGCQKCIRGCFCRRGFVKESGASNAACVPKTQCVQAPQPYQQQCQDPNASLSNCGPACEETCSYRPTTCALPCVTGCFCNNGFVKENDRPTARCVSRNQCSRSLHAAQMQQPRCEDPNAGWFHCGPACPETCGKQRRPCSSNCVPGCFCNTGYVRESTAPNARCVPPYVCDFNAEWRPKPQPQPQSLQVMQTSALHTQHQPQLQQPHQQQQLQKQQQQQPHQQLHQQQQQQHRPQPQHQQPMETQLLNVRCRDPNAKWSQCNGACQPTCQKRAPVCHEDCESGCVCNEGFIKETDFADSRCVPVKSCNVQTRLIVTNQITRHFAKPGVCQPFRPNPYFGRPERHDQCEGDADCEGTAKCCDAMHGFVCMEPVSVQEHQQCANNEEYSPCGLPASCILTCENYNRPPPCVAACGPPACQCRAGYILNTRNHQCVQPQFCNASAKVNRLA